MGMDNYINYTISIYVKNLSINSYDRRIITNCLVHLLDNTNSNDKKLFLKMLNYSLIDDDTKSEEFINSMCKTHNILKTGNIQESYSYRDESPERESNNYMFVYLKNYIIIFISIILLYSYISKYL